MDLETALVNHLENDAGVSAVVGTRIYPNVAGQTVSMPFIVYHRISTPREYTHDGENPLSNPRMQLTMVASTKSAAKDLANQVRFSLAGFKGTMGGSLPVGGAFCENEWDKYEDQIKAFSYRQDWIIYHTEDLS